MNTGKLMDRCGYCDRPIKAHDRAWEVVRSDAALVAAAGYCAPVPGDSKDEDWTDEDGARHSGKVRSGCERLARANPDAVVRKMRRRQAEVATAEQGG